MSKTSKRISKTGKHLGRPKKYANPKEKFIVYNKKKPNTRLDADEKKIILWLRNDPKGKQKILTEIELSQSDVIDRTIIDEEEKKRKYQELREMRRDS